MEDLRRGVTWSDNPVVLRIYLRGRIRRGGWERRVVLSWTMTVGVESKNA